MYRDKKPEKRERNGTENIVTIGMLIIILNVDIFPSPIPFLLRLLYNMIRILY